MSDFEINPRLLKANKAQNKAREKPKKIVRLSKRDRQKLLDMGYTSEEIDTPESEIQEYCEQLVLDLGMGFHRFDERVSQSAIKCGLGGLITKYVNGKLDLYIHKLGSNPRQEYILEFKTPKEILTLKGGLRDSQEKMFEFYEIPPNIAYSKKEAYELIYSFYKGPK